MEEFMELLADVCPDVDFEHETALVDDKVLSSFDILTIIGEISDAYDITISAGEIVPKNFNSAQAMWEMVQRVKG